MNPRKFAPTEPVALEPRAFGMLLMMPYVPAVEDRGGVTVLSIRGPMQQFRDPFCESYDFVVERVRSALETKPRAIVLSIASPGGLVSGVFEAADSIRTMCAGAGVPLFAYVDGAACSAAYALACAAQRIVAPRTASVGSIGVIAEYVDASMQLAAGGVAVRMLTSGARKGDGNPATLAQWPQLARVEEKVHELAELFFAYVAQHRPISADAVRALDAGVFLGAQARGLGLVDEVQTLDELIAAINDGSASTPAPEGVSMFIKPKASKSYEDAIAGLRKAAASDDPEEAKKAKRMLAAELADDDAPPPSDDDEEEARAEGDEPADDDEEDEPEARGTTPAATVSARTAGEVASQANAVETRLRALEAARDRETIDAMIAAHGGVGAELAAIFRTKSVAEVTAMLKAIPKPRKPKLGDHAAAEQVAGTRGDQQGAARADQQRAEEVAAMDRAMGLTSTKRGVVRDGVTLYLGASVPVKATKEAPAAK